MPGSRWRSPLVPLGTQHQLPQIAHQALQALEQSPHARVSVWPPAARRSGAGAARRQRQPAHDEGAPLQTLGFERALPAQTGRPAYHPAVLLKVYHLWLLNRVAPSRRLERECQRNVESCG